MKLTIHYTSRYLVRTHPILSARYDGANQWEFRLRLKRQAQHLYDALLTETEQTKFFDTFEYNPLLKTWDIPRYKVRVHLPAGATIYVS